MKIIPADQSRIADWLDLRVALWPECPRQESEQEIKALMRSSREAAFLAVGPDDRVIGFAEVSTREYVDGCHTRPVGYLEGIFVTLDYRKQGIARRLLEAGESWAAERGCSEMVSDARITDKNSISFHNAVGFRETERQIVFLKEIDKRAIRHFIQPLTGSSQKGWPGRLPSSRNITESRSWACHL